MFDREKLNLLYQMTRASFLAHEKNSMLGMLWHLLNPIAMSMVVYVVFSNVGAFREIPDYPIFILVGVINFNFFTQATARAAQSMLNSRALILNTTVPREILVYRSVCLDGIAFLVEACLVLFLIAVAGPGLTWNAVYYVYVVIGMWLLTTGASLLLAGAVVYLTDLTYIWSVVSRMLFFVTPIFYAVKMIDQPIVARAIELNPLGGMIAIGRRCVIEGQALGGGEIAYALAGPMLFFVLGRLAFRKLEVAIPEAI